MVAALTAAVLVLTSGGAVLHARWDARAEQDLATATADLADATRRWRSARTDAQDALASSALRVADDAVRRELAQLLTGVPALGVDPDAPRAHRTAEARRLAAEAVRRADRLAVATGAVRTARAAWELERAATGHAAARDELRLAVDDAGAVLAASAGRVADDTARLALAAAVDAAVLVRDEPVPTDTAGLDSASDRVRQHVLALDGARRAVAEAEAAWQAEQDRQEAEAAARARTRGASGASAGGSRPSSAAPKPSTGGATRSGGTGGSGAGSGGASGGGSGAAGWASGGPVPEGYRVEVETQGGAWCGTSLGEVWEC
ncbi:hypothetical protein [Cellulomonas sp. NPDC058312]|uniref:hypothetical protein n=1 Tax=Cellulomonas sp. NPDC058312 TaxID=3346441 RepID=UPI0036E94A0D